MWDLRNFTVCFKEQNIYILCKFSLVNLQAETEYSMGTAEHRADIYFLKEKQ